LIHKLTGEFYGDFLQERIFRPLSMTSTRIIGEADIIPNRSAGYQIVHDELKNQDWVSPTLNSTADGALYTTVLDMAKWDAALNAHKLLKDSSYKLMWTPVTLNNGKTYPYGFAWDVTEVHGHRLVDHGGAWQGFTAFIGRYLDDRLTVIALINLDSEHADGDKIGHNVAGIYIPAVMPPALAPMEDKDPRVTALLRETLIKIAAGNPDPDAFTPEMRKAVFPDAVKAFAKDLNSYGALKSLELVGLSDETGDEGETLRQFTYRVHFENHTMVLHVALALGGKIANLGAESE